MNIKSFDTLGKRIEFLLDLKEIKKQELADAINLNPATISNYISGKRNPDVDTLKKIADFLNVNCDFLLLRNDDYQTYISKNINGDLIEIEFDDETLHLTKKEIEKLFGKLESVGFDVKKLL